MEFIKPLIKRASDQESINFALSNRIPRALATRWMGRFSRIESKLLTRISMRMWGLFADDLRLHEAKKSEFSSLHDCFTRELKPGSRSVDHDDRIVVSPCDAVVGAHGDMRGNALFQIKGSHYRLEDLVSHDTDITPYLDGKFLTLRLKSSFYHRFHAPYACQLSDLLYISGDTWNVNPAALKRIEGLFCKNERAVLDMQLPVADRRMLLVPVAAILVASMRIHGLPEPLNLQYKGPNRLPCHRQYKKGDEMGYFEHGSTIVLIVGPGFEFIDEVQEGRTIRMGSPILRIAESSMD